MKLEIKKIIPRSTLDLSASEYLENFLVSAVFSIFAIRTFLSLTGYPQLGGEGLHIAHMLWGGLLMMAAIIILLSFLNRSGKLIASIIGGLGFGTFIDELGKFITSDNNYFFQPTIALIYLIFLILFFIFGFIERHVKITSKDYVINTLELLKEVIHHDLDEEEKKHALSYLEKSDKNDPIVKLLKKTIKSIDPRPIKEKHLFTKIKHFFHQNFFLIVHNKNFARILAIIFILISLINIFSSLRVLKDGLVFWEAGQLVSALLIGGIVIYSLYQLRISNSAATHELLKYAVMIDIFFGQFFLFYREGLSSYLRFVFSIALFFALQYLIIQEKQVQKN